MLIGSPKSVLHEDFYQDIFTEVAQTKQIRSPCSRICPYQHIDHPSVFPALFSVVLKKFLYRKKLYYNTFYGNKSLIHIKCK